MSKGLRRIAAAVMVAICCRRRDPVERSSRTRTRTTASNCARMLAEFEAAINAQNIDRMLAQMDDNVTVIWLNAEVSRGKDEVKAYYGRMVGHDKAILNKYLTKATIGAPAKFYGDVAIADGSAAGRVLSDRARRLQARLALVDHRGQERRRMEDRLAAPVVERVQQSTARRAQGRHRQGRRGRLRRGPRADVGDLVGTAPPRARYFPLKSPAYDHAKPAGFRYLRSAAFALAAVTASMPASIFAAKSHVRPR